jgi:hypothetical protein
VSGVWQPVRAIGDRFGHTEYCDGGALSRDGSTVAESCSEEVTFGTLRWYVRTHAGSNWTVRADLPLEVSGNELGYGRSGLAISANGDTVAAGFYEREAPGLHPPIEPGRVHIFKRNAGVYSKVTELLPGPWRTAEYSNSFGGSIAVSGDGGTVAVGDTDDNGLGTGPRAAPLNPGDVSTGAVYVFRLGTTWRLANVVKPNYIPGGGSNFFGSEMALNGSGLTLIVGNRFEDSGATGIGGNWSNTGATDSGAVFMY